MKKTLISSLAVVAFLFGCEETKLVDDVFDDTRSGAILRTLSSNLEVDLFDRASTISIEIEEQDRSLGRDFQNMDILMSFVDNNFDVVVDANGDPILDADGNEQFIGRNDVAEVLVTTIPASSFSPSADQGLPSFTYSASFTDLIGFLNLQEGEFTGGDVINVRLVARLNDGSEWSVAQGNNNITGGSYFSSPFQYNVNIVCAVDPTFFVGDYQATYVGYSGGFGDILNIGAGSVITLSDGPSSTARQFTIDYNGFGFDMTFILDFVCENVTSRANGLGASCGSGDISTAGNPFPFDIGDDSSFTLSFTETDDGGCGFGAGGVVDVTFTKL